MENTTIEIRPALATIVQGLEASLQWNNTLVTFRENEILEKSWDGCVIFNREKLPKDRPLVVGVHCGDAHADDVACIAMLEAIIPLNDLPHGIVIVRSRNDDELAACDIRFDVGQGIGDHHGPRFAPGVSAVTRCFQILFQTYSDVYPKKVWQVLASIADDIADVDTGKEGAPNKFPWVNAAVRAQRVDSEGDVKKEDEDTLFRHMAMQMRQYLRDEIDCAIAAAEAEDAALRDIEASKDLDRVVVFGREARNADVKQLMYDTKCPAWYYVSPQSANDWRILCCADPEKPYGFQSSWHEIPEGRGLRGEDLSKYTGIPDGIFCHQAGFIAGFATKESAIKFAQYCVACWDESAKWEQEWKEWAAHARAARHGDPEAKAWIERKKAEFFAQL